MSEFKDLSLLEKTIEVLKKARDSFDDEDSGRGDNPYGGEVDEDELGEGFREFNPEDEESAGEDWLKENDPAFGKDNYEDYDDGDDDEAHRAEADAEGSDIGLDPQEADAGDEEAEQPGAEVDSVEEAAPSGGSPAQPEIKAEDAPQEVKGKQGRFRQPSKEEIVSMRGHTRPWEQRARDMTRLQADPSKNPVLHQYGNIIEARNTAHADRKTAYNKLVNSDDYKNADPVAQMDMDDNFEKQWKTSNPEHLSGALKSHGEAHTKGKSAKDMHASAKDAQIRHILSGGAQPEESMSLEEGLQHAGGTKGDEGTTGSVTQDKASSFAHGNKEFINNYAKEYANKASKVKNPEEMMDFNDNSRKDISRILGPGAAKDPKVEAFFSHYYPLIGMSAHKVVNKLGMDKNSPEADMSMLHEAGMHGLMQAINDYDHDHPSGASFSTHAGNKIKGLMQTALRSQDQIPQEVRQAQKKFSAQKAPEVAASAAPKVDIHKMVATSPHPAAPDMHDRLKRVTTQRQVQGIKKPTGGDNV
jgi:hypothetical protein